MSTQPPQMPNRSWKEIYDKVSWPLSLVADILSIFAAMWNSWAIAFVLIVIGAGTAIVLAVKNRGRSWLEVIVALLSLGLFGVVVYLALPDSMTVVASIYDTDGKAVLDAPVSLRDSRGVSHAFEEKAEGHYTFPEVPLGKFRIELNNVAVGESTPNIFNRRVELDIHLPGSATPVTAIVISPLPDTPPITHTPTFTPTPTSTPTPSHTPTFTPTPTRTPIPSPPDGYARMEVYDAFAEPCIDASRWNRLAADGASGLAWQPTPAGQCWDGAPSGLGAQGGALVVNLSNDQAGAVRSGYLIEQPGRTFASVGLRLKTDALDGKWGGIGLFTRLNDEKQTWAYYWLEYGGDLPASRGKLVYEAGDERIDGQPAFSIGDDVTLRLVWSGELLTFYADDREVLHGVPFSGDPDTFGVYWAASPNSTLGGRVEEYRVTWK